jgi:hypothetical protein
MEHLVLLSVAPRSVVFIIFTFSLVALFFFFFFLIVFFLPTIVIVVVVLRQLWLFYRCSVRLLSLRYHDHNLEWFLILRRVVLQLLLRRHIPWSLLSNALLGCAVSTSHLKIGSTRE